MQRSTRRDFLGAASLAAGAVALAPRAWAARSANEQINLGIIGCGWRGGQLADAFNMLEGVRIAGLCDPDQQRLEETSEKAPDAHTWTDLRRLLDSPDIDAVAIANCNHWHCLSAIWALEAGKHVYVEKPLCNMHWEGQQVVKAARKHKRICQVGTQQRSDPLQSEIKQLLHDDALLGEIQWVRVNRFGVREPIGKQRTPLKIPASVDYDLWLGPARDEPLYRNKFHYDWHWDWNTGSGEMGNWGVHLVDDVRNNVFRDRVAFPKRVIAAGGRFIWDDAGETPNVHFAVLDTGDVPVVIALTNLTAGPGKKGSPEHVGPGSGYVVTCEGGRLEGHRGGATAFDADGKKIKQLEGTGGMGAHQQNFLDAIRSGDADSLNAPAEVGHHSTAWCNLANYAFRAGNQLEGLASGGSLEEFTSLDGAAAIHEELRSIVAAHDPQVAERALRMGPALEFDSEREQFVGDHASVANQYVRFEGRPPYVVPEI